MISLIRVVILFIIIFIDTTVRLNTARLLWIAWFLIIFICEHNERRVPILVHSDFYGLKLHFLLALTKLSCLMNQTTSLPRERTRIDIASNHPRTLFRIILILLEAPHDFACTASIAMIILCWSIGDRQERIIIFQRKQDSFKFHWEFCIIWGLLRHILRLPVIKNLCLKHQLFWWYFFNRETFLALFLG